MEEDISTGAKGKIKKLLTLLSTAGRKRTLRLLFTACTSFLIVFQFIGMVSTGAGGRIKKLLTLLSPAAGKLLLTTSARK